MACTGIYGCVEKYALIKLMSGDYEIGKEKNSTHIFDTNENILHTKKTSIICHGIKLDNNEGGWLVC